MPYRPFRVLPRSLLSVAAVGFAASTAVASVTLESLHRELSTFGVLDVAGVADDQFEVNEVAVDIAGLFNDQRATVLKAHQSSIASDAWQVSDVTTTAFILDGAFASQGLLGPGGLLAEGFGVSLARLQFHVDEPRSVRLAGQLEASGNATTLVRLDDALGGNLFERNAMSSQLQFDDVVVLGTGTWTLFVQTGGYGRADANATTPSAGQFTISVDVGAVTSAGMHSIGAAFSVAPNPMRNECVVRFAPQTIGGAGLVVHDVAGRRVRSLGRVNGTPVRWDARDDRGIRVPAGVYWIRAGDAAERVIVTR